MFGALAAAPALAENSDPSGIAGHFQFRFRGVVVLPEASGKVTAGGVAIPGSLSISDSVIPEVDATYFVTDHIAVEAIAIRSRRIVTSPSRMSPSFRSPSSSWASAASRLEAVNVRSAPPVTFQPASTRPA